MRVRQTLLCLVPLAFLAARPLVHTHLVKAVPAENDTVKVAPKTIELWFAEEPDLKLSGITLKSGADTLHTIVTGRVQRGTDPKSVKVTISGHLSPGVFIVSWRTAGDDGHIERGQYRFTVK